MSDIDNSLLNLKREINKLYNSNINNVGYNFGSIDNQMRNHLISIVITIIMSSIIYLLISRESIKVQFLYDSVKDENNKEVEKLNSNKLILFIFVLAVLIYSIIYNLLKFL